MLGILPPCPGLYPASICSFENEAACPWCQCQVFPLRDENGSYLGSIEVLSYPGPGDDRHYLDSAGRLVGLIEGQVHLCRSQRAAFVDRSVG